MYDMTMCMTHPGLFTIKLFYTSMSNVTMCAIKINVATRECILIIGKVICYTHTRMSVF